MAAPPLICVLCGRPYAFCSCWEASFPSLPSLTAPITREEA